MPNLVSIEECERLTVREVHDLYRQYVNASQVNLMTSFGFGRDLVDSAEGAYLTLGDGRRILDLTGGVGVLNHGHNHPRILAARQRFAERRRMEVHKTYFSPTWLRWGTIWRSCCPATSPCRSCRTPVPRRWKGP